jgi:hypothetical protein
MQPPGHLAELNIGRFWRALTLVARIDIAASLSIAAALSVWMVLH